MLELARGKLPVGVVYDVGHVVCSNVCSVRNILSTNRDVVGVDQEEPFSELAHHGGGLQGEMREDTEDIFIVLVEKKTSPLELREERLDSDAHCLQLLEDYVRQPLEAPGLDAVV